MEENRLKMKRSILTIALLLITLCTIVAKPTDDMDLVLLPETTSPGGRCMDGSMAGYYIRDGDPNLFVINLQGGGFCADKIKCDSRNGTSKAGSSYWSNTMRGTNFLDVNCTNNPVFCNATSVHVKYCTGDTHRGSRNVPSNETWGYYFDGHLNFKAIIEKLIADTGLAQLGNKVLLTGNSAGGVGVYYNIDWLANRLPGVIVKGVPNAGWQSPAALEGDLPEPFSPSDYPHFANGTSGNADYNAYINGEEKYDVWKIGEILPKDCVADFGEDLAFACSSVHFAYPYINSSLFTVHTQYDSLHIFSQGKAPKKSSTLEEADTIELYVEMWGEAVRASLQMILNNETKITKPQPDGVFAASCILHGTELDTYIDGMNYITIASDWFLENGEYEEFYRLIETCPSSDRELPCNEQNTCKLVIPEICSITEDIYNKTFYIPTDNYCLRLQVFENGTLEFDNSDPTCSNDVFNSVGVLSIFDYSNENIAHFKVGPGGYSGSFAFEGNELTDELVLIINNFNEARKKYAATVILPMCAEDPTPVPSTSPSMIPSELSPSLCPIEYIYNATLYVSAAGACWRVQVFDSGTLEADISDPTCSRNAIYNLAGVFSIFESGLGNSAYFEVGDNGYSGTFSFEESPIVIGQEFELVDWNQTTKVYDIIITFPNCTAEK